MSLVVPHMDVPSISDRQLGIELAQNSRPKFRRAGIACRRCRRLRIKCRHEAACPPCQRCHDAGQECVFPEPGEPDYDRAFRQEGKSSSQGRTCPEGRSRPRLPSTALRGPETTAVSPSPAALPGDDRDHREWLEANWSGSSLPVDAGWDLLPPFDEVVEGCRVFTTSYFQLGFIPKTIFFERLIKEPRSVSAFLLLSILSISARFTPSLIKRYNGGLNATDIFLRRAETMALSQIYQPSLEAIQGFFLIGLAEGGKGDKYRGSIHTGLAVRMAGILLLHREETYRLPEDATADDIINAEAARRTFWMLENHDSLYSGYRSPVSFSLGDITALLPCDEREFAFGLVPVERAALMGTPPAIDQPRLTNSPSRSLFATLIQAHNLWGQVARRIASNEGIQRQEQAPPTSSSIVNTSDHVRLCKDVLNFEKALPPQHRWSIWNLRGFKAEGLDLAYLSIVMILKLSNIILRRRHLQEATDDGVQTPDGTLHERDGSGSEVRQRMLKELFDNMLVLHEQIEAFISLRSPDQGFPVLILFCVYICGSLANSLARRPHLCSSIAPHAPQILAKSIVVLGDLQDAWPMARCWSDALNKACESQATPREMSLSDHSVRRVSQAQNPDPGSLTHCPRGMINSPEPRSSLSTPYESSDRQISDFNLQQETRLPGALAFSGVVTTAQQDSWSHVFPGVGLTDYLEPDLATYLWPA